MTTRFRDRAQAGRLLACAMEKYATQPNVLVLALSRGGVPVAFEVARKLKAPLDVFMVRKLGLPTQPELAIGAIATGGVRVLERFLNGGIESGNQRLDCVIEQMGETDRQENGIKRVLRPSYR